MAQKPYQRTKRKKLNLLPIAMFLLLAMIQVGLVIAATDADSGPGQDVKLPKNYFKTPSNAFRLGGIVLRFKI